MILDDLAELRISGVFDRGVPNSERIVVSVHDSVNMAQYGLLLGIRGDQQIATPISDNFYWFGEGLVQAGELIFVYTGPGNPVNSTLPGSNTKTYSVHWGRKETVLGNLEVVPVLIRIDAIDVYQNPPLIPSE